MMNNTEEILVELSEPQGVVLESRASIILNMAGQGGGKSLIIGLSSGMLVSEVPQLVGFIGANTDRQLSQSTLHRVLDCWKNYFGFTEYNAKSNKAGAFVVNKEPPAHFRRFTKLPRYQNTISFYNGALIFIGSLENYKAHDGKEFAWAHLDETKDTKEEALKDVIIGRLRQYGFWYDTKTLEYLFDPSMTAEEAERKGFKSWNPLYIHTSPALGGVPWLNKLFDLNGFEKEIKREVMKKEKGFFHRKFSNKEVVVYSAHHNAHNLPPDYIANQELNLVDEEKILKLIYGYPFSKSGGEWFPYFRRDVHLKKYDHPERVPIHQTWDFNASPYVTQLNARIYFKSAWLDKSGKKYDKQELLDMEEISVMVIHFYKEYCLRAPRDTTQDACEAFAQDHDPQFDEIFYYGDGSGLSRIPGLGSLSNFGIVEECLFPFIHNDSKKVRFPNIPPFTRRDLVNKILKGAIPYVELYIDPEGCPELVEDCELVKKGQKGKIKEEEVDPITKKKFEKRGHPTDAMEYLVSEVCKEYIV